MVRWCRDGLRSILNSRFFVESAGVSDLDIEELFFIQRSVRHGP